MRCEPGEPGSGGWMGGRRAGFDGLFRFSTPFSLGRMDVPPHRLLCFEEHVPLIPRRATFAVREDTPVRAPRQQRHG
jgi:hypothetical protein